MSEDELKALKKEVSTKKRIATEWASQIHDLVEDRLPAAYLSGKQRPPTHCIRQ